MNSHATYWVKEDVNVSFNLVDEKTRSLRLTHPNASLSLLLPSDDSALTFLNQLIAEVAKGIVLLSQQVKTN